MGLCYHICMLTLDITNVLGKTITPSLGIGEQELSTIGKTVSTHVEQFLKERSEGNHAWAQAPYDLGVINLVKEMAALIAESRIQTILWLGIGGSSLGPRVIKEVFETSQTPELLILDTIDPAVLNEELKLINWKRTMVVIASKSGGTLEPMAAFFVVRSMLKEKIGEEEFAKHIIAITDPTEGVLRTLAREEGYHTLPIEPGIGGRYSIVTPIGLLPLAVLGGDMDAFVRGMKEMDTRCQEKDARKNPAALLAAVQFLLDTKKSYLIRVIMPYSTRLQSLGRWEQQLIAESLGKTEAYGPSPLAGIGTQDQHSMLQQWMQGRRVAWHVFIRETKKEHLTVDDVPIPELQYLQGKELGSILDALYEGTAQSLLQGKRPSVTLTLPELDAYHLGQLFFLFMAEVVLLGKLYRVDPYGQPGVELGKKIAKGVLVGNEAKE